MIIGIPSPTAIHDAGLGYLCLAWIDLFDLIWSADEYSQLQAEVEGVTDDLVAAHWKVAARRLSTCATLVHQGAEFLLKARIVEISPFLLLDGPSGWAKRAMQEDTDFSEFKTLDARLLVQVHDTVCAQRLPESFRQQFDRLRTRRNAVTHGLPTKITLAAEDILKEILEISAVLVGCASWPKIRREHELRQRATWSDYHGSIPRCLMDELARALTFLTPEESERYFGIAAEERFICMPCHQIDLRPDPPIKLALRNACGNAVTCVVCGETTPFIESSCPECAGTVLSEDNECLSCGQST